MRLSGWTRLWLLFAAPWLLGGGWYLWSTFGAIERRTCWGARSNAGFLSDGVTEPPCWSPATEDGSATEVHNGYWVVEYYWEPWLMALAVILLAPLLPIAGLALFRWVAAGFRRRA